jgi:polyhydroxyalkanoate synthase
VEHLVHSGQQVFVLSWRNPDARHAAWGLDTYIQAVLDALDAVARIARTERAVLTGVCAGGILACLVAGHLAGNGRLDRLAGLGLAVTLLDQRRAGVAAALTDRHRATLAVARARPLLGRTPRPFDVLFWNADTTRMSAQLYADFVDLALGNRLAEPGGATALGVPVDLGRVSLDAYVVAGVSDHITPWTNCYRATSLLGGETRFVLSSSGHVAALVNPPGNQTASHRVNPENPADPAEWLRGAATRPGSWWPDFADWLGARCGGERRAPRRLGGRGLPALIDAPGTYVFDH